MATASDDFNRANETPLAGNWTSFTASKFNLAGNVVVPAATGSDSTSIWNANAFANDQFSQAALTVNGTNGGGAGLGLCLRSDGNPSRTLYRLVIDHAASNNIDISRFNAGANSPLKQVTQAWTDGDTWRFEITGFVLSVYRNGALVTTFDDSASGSKIASGSVGISYSSTETSASLDNWSGGDLAGPVMAHTFQAIPFM